MNSLLQDAQAAGAHVGLKGDRITINGGIPLRGRIELKGAKNLVTKAMVAALLGEGPFTFISLPLKWRDGTASPIRAVAVFAM